MSYAKLNWDVLDWDDDYFEDAIACFERVIAIAPENCDACFE
ncbi:MAG: hypothetical protein RMY34_15910 [Aulosira sp. DedQUE10]|nr:hypothetical protein [Aulosira sp. DedQUE10]